MNKNCSLAAWLLVSCLLFASSPARAQLQLNFTLNPTNSAATPGAFVYYGATLQNTGTTSLDLVSGTPTVASGPGTSSTTDDNYFGNAPFTLSAAGTAGDRYTFDGFGTASGALFRVLVSQAATPGDTIFGSYDVQFTPSGGTTQTATQNFSISVSPVPAPPGLAAGAIGLAVAGLRARRRRALA